MNSIIRSSADTVGLYSRVIHRPEETKLPMLLGICEYRKNIFCGLVWLIGINQCLDLLMSIIIVRIFSPRHSYVEGAICKKTKLAVLAVFYTCHRKGCLPKFYALWQYHLKLLMCIYLYLHENMNYDTYHFTYVHKHFYWVWIVFTNRDLRQTNSCFSYHWNIFKTRLLSLWWSRYHVCMSSYLG